MTNFSVKKLFWILLIILVGTLSLIGIYQLTKLLDFFPQTVIVQNYNPPPIAPVEGGLPKTIGLILVGDIMLDRGVEYTIEKEGNGDFKFPFLKIAEELQKADIVFGNLEGPISDKGEKVGSIYSFRNNPKSIEGLRFAGFNVISLANNHAFDYGREALEDTLKRLNEAGINYIGAGINEKEAFSPIIKETNGTKIAFLAYTNLGSPYWRATETSSGIAWVDWNYIEKIKNDIQEAKSQADILIVSLHSGEEYTSKPSQFQIEFSKAAIDAGADLVIGHHPHVIQLNERYQNGYIFYSLGNFIFDQGFSEETMKSQILRVTIDNDKMIKEVVPINIKINSFFQVEKE